MKTEKFYVWERGHNILDAREVGSRRELVSLLMTDLGLDADDVNELRKNLDSCSYAYHDRCEIATGARAEKMRKEALSPSEELNSWIRAEESDCSCNP